MVMLRRILNMLKVRVLWSMTFFFAVSAAHTQDLSGLCIDNIEAGCMDRFLPFNGRSIDFCEVTCELSSPVNVRGLNATLFDFVCIGDNGRKPERVMLIEQTDFSGNKTLSIIEGRQTRQIVQCPS